LLDREKLKQGKQLPLMESFYSIQGEGAQTGNAAYFIRIGGCDVGCYWCDVKESWDPKIHPVTDTEDIIKPIISSRANAVIVTGGEPLMYNLDYLCNELHENNIKLFLETSGAYALSGEWDWICLSPKKKKEPLIDIYNKANEIKVIIFNECDFEWAEECATRVNDKCMLFLQPEWSNREAMMTEIVNYVLDHPKWGISLQSHKYIGIP